MNSFFARLDLANNRFSPQLKLDGQWETALYDISITSSKSSSPSQISNEKILTKEDFPILSEPREVWADRNIMLFMVKLKIDRMVRYESLRGHDREVREMEPEDVAATRELRKAFKLYKYGNNKGYGTQSSQFDKWNYQIDLEARNLREAYIMIPSSVLWKYWREDPTRKLTLTKLCQMITENITTKMGEAEAYLRNIFKDTAGKLIITQPPYFYNPELSYVNGFLNISTPWFIHKIYTHPEFHAIAKMPELDKWGNWFTIFRRDLMRVPNYVRGHIYYGNEEGGTEYEFNTEKYYIGTPTQILRNYIGRDASDGNNKNGDSKILKIKIPHILEETKIGPVSEPLLRITSWAVGQIYKEFKLPLYVPLRYGIIDDFNIEVTNSEGDKITSGFATLHFRKKYDC